MAELNVQQQNIIKQLKQAYPELKSYSDEQILSLYNQQLNNVQLTEAEKISIMNGKNGVVNDGMGIQLETSQKAVSKEQEVQLKSALTARLNAVSTNVKKAEVSNGFLGTMWSGFKNLTGIGDSSDKVREQQKADLKAFESGNIAEAFKQITGLDYTVENVNKFLNNEVQTKSEMALNGYIEGQDMASDVTADIVSGIAAVGIYTAAVAAAPFTGGASIVVGVAAAGASAAAIKTGIKYADAKSGGREYTADNLKKDLATGAFSGVLAPITGGMGGAVGKTVATKVGIQAVKQVGKEVAEEAVDQTAKGFVKTMLTNPTGYEYIGGNIAKRGLAFAAEAATDGAVGGAVDNAFRTAYDGGSVDEVAQAAVEGFVGGAAMAPVIGGGMKVAGKGAQKVFGKNNVEIDANGNRVRVNNDGTVVRIDENGNEIAASATDAEIYIPKGRLGAPRESFLETDDAFRDIVRKRANDIVELNKIKDVDEFLKKSFSIIKEEMGLSDSPIKFEITDGDNQYDLETNTVSINRNWANGDKAELFGAIAHELDHFLQWKEVILNYDQDSDYWEKVFYTLQKTENGQANLDYIMNKYPDNIELQEFFNKAKSYEENWQNYIDPTDPKTGKVDVTSERYKRYKEQPVESEAMRRGDIVVEEYQRAISTNDGIDSRLTSENTNYDLYSETSDALPNKRTTNATIFTPPKRQDLIDEAVKVNDVTRPELVQFAKEMQDLGFTDDKVAKFVNWHKTKEGSINRNLLPVLEKMYKLKLVSKDLIEVAMNPDGSINQKNFDAIDFFSTKFNTFGSKDNMTGEGIAAWIKVAKDSEGNFSEARFNELSKMLDETIDLNKNIPSTFKQAPLNSFSTSSKNNTLPTNTKGLFLEACLDEAGNIHPQKLECVQNLLNTGMKPLDLSNLINLAQKHNKTISDYYDVAYSVVLKDSFRTNKNVYIMPEIESLLNANGTVSREALNIYNLIGPTEVLDNLTTGIFRISKDAKGNFSKENYDFLLNALAKYPECNRQNLNTIENIAKLSKDANGKIIEQDFNTVKTLAYLNVTVNAVKLIMSNCKRNGNFNSNLFDKFINIIKQQQPADISEVKSTNIFIEKGKVYFVTVLNNGKSKKKAFSCNDINIELISGLTSSKDKNGSKIFVEKATDASGISQKITSTQNIRLKEQTKIIRDANGKAIRYEHYTESDIPGIYDIRVRDANTGETKILSTAKIDKKTGNVSVIKDFESSDGIRTQYQYLDDPQGNRSFEYRIFDEDGNVLMEDRQTFTVLTENKFISTYNDRLYNIEFTEHTLTVSCKNSGEKVVFILNNFIESANKQPLLDLLKQLPGHELIELYKSTNKLTFIDNKMKSLFDHSNKELKVGFDISVLLHEAGHGKHTFDGGSRLFEVNSDIQKAYLEELDSFKKIATDREQDFIAYFIDPKQHTQKPWKDVGLMFETIAESNSLLTTYYHSPELAIRAQYLQQHFPKTIAAISKAMKEDEYLVRAFDSKPLITKVTKGREKDIITVDSETEQYLQRTAKFYHQQGLNIQEAIANRMRQFGFGTNDRQTLTYRTKSIQSLLDKLKNFAIDNFDKNKTISDAINSVRDLVGTRTVVKSADYTTHPDVKRLIEVGDTEAAILRAAELQSEPTLQRLKDLIEKNAKNFNELSIVRISNYMGNEGIPYFSERQLADLKWFAERRGVKLDFVVRAPETDPKFDQMNISLANSKNPTKIRESGYTALQINFKTSSGQVFEWQFRGDKVNVFAEAEHVPYDLRTNKDIISGNPELAPLYEPIKTMLSKDTMSEPVYNRYNEYLTDFYKHLRKLELGFESNAPRLEDYGNYDQRLNATNLIILHEFAEKIKNTVKAEGPSSPKIQDFINEYNALVNS